MQGATAVSLRIREIRDLPGASAGSLARRCKVLGYPSFVKCSRC